MKENEADKRGADNPVVVSLMLIGLVGFLVYGYFNIRRALTDEAAASKKRVTPAVAQQSAPERANGAAKGAGTARATETHSGGTVAAETTSTEGNETRLAPLADPFTPLGNGVLGANQKTNPAALSSPALPLALMQG